jgi:DUF1365 family protein
VDIHPRERPATDGRAWVSGGDVVSPWMAGNAMIEAPAALYPSRVAHRRRVAPFYRFVYRVFYILWDVDRIDEALRGLRLVSRNRFNVLSFHDRDHGAGEPGGLRRWAEGVCADGGIALDGGRVRLLAFPRVFGFAFNPISIWYCEHRDGSLRAVIAEVRNTFGERHSYLLASGGAVLPYQGPHEKEKCFHVSPFFDLVGRYRFTSPANACAWSSTSPARASRSSTRPWPASALD